MTMQVGSPEWWSTRRTEEERRLAEQQAQEAERQRIEAQRKAEEERQRQEQERQRQAEQERQRREQEQARQAQGTAKAQPPLAPPTLEQEAARLEQQAREPIETKVAPLIAAGFGQEFALAKAQEYRREAQSAKEKANILREAQRIEETIKASDRDIDRALASPEQYEIDQASVKQYKSDRAKAQKSIAAVKALTSKEASPYVTFTEGGYMVNIAAALKAGVSPKKIRSWGVSSADIQTIQQALAEGKTAAQLKPLTLKEYKAQIAAQQIVEKDFMKRNTQLRDGNWVSKVTLASVKKESPDLHKILVTQGFDAYSQEINRLRGEYEKNKLAISMLKNYTDAEGGVDGAKYLRDNTGDLTTLSNAGFTDKTIDEWQEYNEQPWVRTTKHERYIEALLQAGGNPFETDIKTLNAFLDSHPRLKAMQKPEPPLKDHKAPEVSLSQFTENFLATRGIEEVPIWDKNYKTVGLYKGLAEAEYTRLYGAGATARSMAIDATTLVFAPARVMKPEVTFRDISGMEWGVGAAQIMLLAAPTVGGVLSRAGLGTAARIAPLGMQLGAGGVFTADTIKNWNQMSEADRVVSSIIDTVIIGSALWGLVPRPTGRYPKLTGDVIDTSGRVIGKKVKYRVSTAFTNKDAAFAQETGGIKQLTEGGKVGAGWDTVSNTGLVKAVAEGEKPLAVIVQDITDVEALKLAQQQGLKTRYYGQLQLKNGDIVNRYTGNGQWELQKVTKPITQKSYLVFRDTADGQLAYKRWVSAQSIDVSTPAGRIRYDWEVGKALGYTDADIRAYLQHSANLDIAIDSNFALKRTLYDLSYALRTGNANLIKEAGKRLQLIGAEIPKQLGGGQIIAKGVLLESAPEDFLSLTKTKAGPSQLGGVGKKLEANKVFIETAERALRKIKDAKKKAAIEKVLREARRQVRLAERIQVKPLIQQPGQFPAGRFLPAIITKGAKLPARVPPKPVPKPSIKSVAKKASRASVFPGIKSKAKKGKTTYKGQRAFEKPDIKDIEEAELEPVTSIIISPKGKLISAPKIRTVTRVKPTPKEREREKVAPFPTVLTMPEVETRVKPGTKTKPLAGTKVQPLTGLQEQTQPQIQEKTKTGLKQKIREKAKLRVPSEEESPKEWTREEIKSSVKWRDGFVVHCLKSPYRRHIDEKSFHISNLPPEIDMADILDIKGKGSQQASARVTGKFPAKLTVDVGNQDVIITRGPGRRVRMRHARDVRGTVSQTTIKRQGRPKRRSDGWRNLSKKRGRQYHTRIDGSDVLSRRPIRGK